MTVLRLMRYELKKILYSRFLIASIITLLGVEIILSCNDWKSFGDQRPVVKNMRMTSEMIVKMNERDRQVFYTTMQELYGTHVFEEIPMENTGLFEVPGYLGAEIPDFTAILCYQSYTKYNKEIEETIDRVINLAKMLGREALKENDSFNIRRNLRILKLYSVSRPKVSGYTHGIDKFICASEITMLPVLLVVFLLTANIFSKEKQTGVQLLILTSEKGYRHTAEAKYLMSILSAAIITAVFQGASLITVGLQDGFSSLSDNISAIPELRLSPFVLSISYFLVGQFLTRCMVSALAAAIFSTCSVLAEKEIISYAACSSVLLFFLCYMIFPAQCFPWNPCALISLNRFLSSYNVFNLVGFPVMKLFYFLSLYFLVSVCLVFLGIRIHGIRKGLI